MRRSRVQVTSPAPKNRILFLCGEKGYTINKLATELAIAPSAVKSILYGNRKNPGIVTLKILCDGSGISLSEFFASPGFENPEQEIK